MDAVERPAVQWPPIGVYELANVVPIVKRAPSCAMAALRALMYATAIEISFALAPPPCIWMAPITPK